MTTARRLLAPLLLLGLLCPAPQAAERQPLSHQPELLNAARSQPDLALALGLGAEEQLAMTRSLTDPRGFIHRRYRQLYRGVPIWGESITVSRWPDGRISHLNGQLIRGLQRHHLDTRPQIAAAAALAQAKGYLQGNSAAELLFRDESNELVIYLNGAIPRLCYAIQMVTDVSGGGQPSRPTLLLDAHSGERLLEYDGLTHQKVGTGPGGNEKQAYTYEEGGNLLDVTVSGSQCTMNTQRVKSVDLNHGTQGSTAFDFPCFENAHKAINGAFSPINDAHFFGDVVFDLYDQWIGVAPLTTQLIMRVHYSTNYENAFWDGTTMTFGDGYTRFYPLVSLDVVSHEVSHGFTEQHSNLIYSGQSGGINEAFSDMAGEAAEYFLWGATDFLVGAQIFKADGALRYMADPTLDGRSIGHASDYVSGMDVHYSSGVYNRAFYLLASRQGWDVRQAFILFAHANRYLWGASESFDSAYYALLDAADQLYGDQAGARRDDIQSAFSQVGIPKPPPAPACDSIESVHAQSFSIGNLTAATGTWRCWQLTLANNTPRLDVTLSGASKGRNRSSGDADLYLRHGEPPRVDPTVPEGLFDCGSYNANNNEQCSIETPQAGEWFLAVYAYEGYSAVRLDATVSEGQPPSTSNIELTAQVKGGRKPFVALNWSGASGSTVYLLRDTGGAEDRIYTADNDGGYKDNDGRAGYRYQLCETLEGPCSDPVEAR
ncbi:peptidase M4 family protein [Ferrimonas sediminicola]|uniref:Peptidase M4 family protein n=1 Tax=Ferrimonas sediminicola TaxID=2569538 RepID=A0A4U1BJS2_9GAMM|nr:M4 family metallopeptidase [Ferrimonas sediminicola]TKB51435.1 peptidase M4 family protein [Ferrimonas sediminicola]